MPKYIIEVDWLFSRNTLHIVKCVLLFLGTENGSKLACDISLF